MFVNVPTRTGNLSLNLANVNVVEWALDAHGRMRASIHFMGDTGDALRVEGAGAVVLSAALTSLEAETEREVNAALSPAGVTLYASHSEDDCACDEDEEFLDLDLGSQDALLDCEATILSGPPDVA